VTPLPEEAHSGSEARSSPTTPDWLPQAGKALDELLALPPDWDSYGARAIQPDIVRAARRLLSDVARPDTPQPTLVPTVQGGVQLEWHVRGVDVEIELLTADRAHVSYVDGTEVMEWETPRSPGSPRLTELIARLSSLATE
jgi:hypothetical protein